MNRKQRRTVESRQRRGVEERIRLGARPNVPVIGAKQQASFSEAQAVVGSLLNRGLR